MLLSDKNKLSTLLHNAPCSAAILDFYRRNSRWFNERRLRRLVFHTSVENDHLVLPGGELFLYASRLLSMEEAFLFWFAGLSKPLKSLVLLLVRHSVLSADYAYKEAGILSENFSDPLYKSVSKTEILNDISTKQKYVLENIAVHKDGFIYCPALFRGYIACHLSALPEYKNLGAAQNLTEDGNFSPVPAGKVFSYAESGDIIEEKLKSAGLLAARTLKEAVSATASASNSFDAEVLVPHLHLSARYWNSPKTTAEKLRQADTTATFLESSVFENWTSFSSIENSFNAEIIDSVPKFFLPADGNGYFARLKSAKPWKPHLNSSCFGKRLSLAGGDFLYSFVSVPAFNNLLLVLCALGVFECTLEENPESTVHSAILYPLGKIAAVRRIRK